RREALVLLGAVGVATFAGACGGDGDSDSSARGTGGRREPSTSSATGTTGSTGSTGGAVAVDCVLAPEMTEGPYYLANEAVRSDITEGRPGTPLQLRLTVASVAASACSRLAGANVDIWHADATGNYSGFGATSSSRTFLRGVQTTDRNGEAVFATVYP